LARLYETTGNYEAWFEIYKNQYGGQYDDGFIPEIEKVLHEQGYIPVIEALINYHEEKHRKGERIGIGAQADWYLKIGNYDRAMDYFEEMYEVKDPNLPFISGNVIQYPELKDNPRYIALLKKMNLPLP
jgi:tetratricopeptide (TPR) repeat protein